MSRFNQRRPALYKVSRGPSFERHRFGSSACRTAAHGADGVRRTPRYDRGIPCGSSRSTVLRTRFARVNAERRRAVSNADRLNVADKYLSDVERPLMAKRSFGERTITLEAKAWLTSLSCRKVKELGYPHELWTTRLLARHARDHGPAEGHPCLANTKTAVARVAAPDWSCAGSRGGAQNPRHRASGCRRHTAGLRHRACASAGH
jgi:hypothetical protein